MCVSACVCAKLTRLGAQVLTEDDTNLLLTRQLTSVFVFRTALPAVFDASPSHVRRLVLCKAQLATLPPSVLMATGTCQCVYVS